MDLYVAVNGNDRWTGRLPAPDAAGTDGPFATIQGARDAVRGLRGGHGPKEKTPGPPAALSEPVTVHVRGGRYAVAGPVVFGPEDSYPATYAAYRNERPVVDGGVRITGWRETKVNGRRAWEAAAPGVPGAAGFRELFVDGRRAPRPRLPKKGLFRMAAVPGMNLPAGWGDGGQTAFVCNPGDIRPFANIADAEIVYVHYWIEERSPIASFDPAANLVTMARPSRSALVGCSGSQLADYYVENVLEALTEPGEWYLDRSAGRILYLPRPGEDPDRTEIVAPRCLQLLALLGRPEENAFVEFIRFRGISFMHTDWRHPAFDGAEPLGSSASSAAPFSRRHNRGRTAAAAQAAADIPGVVTLEGARSCAIEDCAVEHAGWYGIEIGDGCRDIRVVGNAIRDLGAGGVKINGASARDPETARRTGFLRITDNTIEQGGRVFHSAVGILAMHAHNLHIAHNLIRDLFYSGISCGWEWGYQENVSRENVIEKNHIHTIGQGLLSDMGGVYTLGVQPGTVVRANLIHDIRSAHYGGWCIYPDEGSSHILIEGNVCHDADRHAFHQHYGRENIVRNNIFAFGGEAVATYSRTDNHNGITFLRNIFVTEGKPFFAVGYSHALADRRFQSELNCFFDVSRKPPAFGDRENRRVSLREWRTLGHDTRSIVADPGFRNWKKRDFRLQAGSPALKIGFKPLDTSDVGPRPRAKRD